MQFPNTYTTNTILSIFLPSLFVLFNTILFEENTVYLLAHIIGAFTGSIALSYVKREKSTFLQLKQIIISVLIAFPISLPIIHYFNIIHVTYVFSVNALCAFIGLALIKGLSIAIDKQSEKRIGQLVENASDRVLGPIKDKEKNGKRDSQC